MSNVQATYSTAVATSQPATAMSAVQFVPGDSACLLFDDGKSIYAFSLECTLLCTITPVYQLNGWTFSGNDLYVQDGPVTLHYNIGNFSSSGGKPAPDCGYNLLSGVAYSQQLAGGLSSCTIGNSGGANYAKGDTLTLSGGNSGQVRVMSVSSSGAIQTIKVSAAGAGYAIASNVATTTSGNGSGATIDIVTVVQPSASSLYSAKPPASLDFSPPALSTLSTTTQGGLIFVLATATNEIVGLQTGLYTQDGYYKGLPPPATPATLFVIQNSTYVQYLDTTGQVVPVDFSETYGPGPVVAAPFSTLNWTSLNAAAATYSAEGAPQASITFSQAPGQLPIVYGACSVPVGSWQLIATNGYDGANVVFVTSQATTGGILGGPEGNASPLLLSAPCIGSTGPQTYALFALTSTATISLESYPLTSALTAPATNSWAMLNSQMGAAVSSVQALLSAQVNSTAPPATVAFDSSGFPVCFAAALQACGASWSFLNEQLKIGGAAAGVVGLSAATLNADASAGYTFSEVATALGQLCGTQPQTLVNALVAVNYPAQDILSSVLPFMPASAKYPMRTLVAMLPLAFVADPPAGQYNPLDVFTGMARQYMPEVLWTLINASVTGTWSTQVWWWSLDTQAPYSVSAAYQTIGSALQTLKYCGPDVVEFCYTGYSDFYPSGTSQPEGWTGVAMAGSDFALALLACYVNAQGKGQNLYTNAQAKTFLTKYWTSTSVGYAMQQISLTAYVDGECP